MNFSILRTFLLPAILLTGLAATAQQPVLPRDTTRRPPSSISTSGPKAFKDVITDKARTDDGLFKIHRVDDKWFFDIPDSLLGRDIIVVNRIIRSSVNSPKDFGGYAGDQINESVIRFEKGPSNKIYLKSVSYTTISKDSTQPMYQAVMNSNIQPIAASFDIKAFSKDSAGTIIEVTDYLNSDNDVIAFASGGAGGPTSVILNKASFQAGNFQTDKSYVSNVRAFPLNLEIKMVKTYSKTSSPGLGGPSTAPGSQSNITLEINSSFVL